MPHDWKDIRYLEAGSLPQQLAYRLLRQAAILPRLHAYDPILVGTFPLDITVPGSDLDIICAVYDFAAFLRATAYFSALPAYAVRPLALQGGVPAQVVSFILEGVEVEIFGQPIATEQQNGYRHMVVEARLLEAGGSALKQQVIACKASGLKTEPAFAQLLSLPGNPYQALLALEDCDAAALQTLIVAAGFAGSKQ